MQCLAMEVAKQAQQQLRAVILLEARPMALTSLVYLI
jgi:hypothetical protein